MFHNLLQKEQRKTVRWKYYSRLFVVTCGALSAAVLLGAVALIPAYALVYVHLFEVRAESTQYREESDTRGVVREEVDTATTLAVHMTPYVHAGAMTPYIQAVLESRPEAVEVTGFSYNHKARKLVLYGNAATRGDLVSFTDVLEADELFAKVSLPISDLAANTNLDFHITLLLTKEVLGATP